MVTKNQDNVIVLPEIDYLITYEQLNALITFQKLWTELSAWLRSMLVSTAEDLDNKTAVMDRLYSVIADFYSTLRVFYGPVIAQQFSDLLATLVTNARILIEALKDGDNERADMAIMQMYRTADNMAEFMGRTNVYWDTEQWRHLLYQFIRLYLDEVTAMLTGNYELEISIFDRLDDITDIMGSYMARGIIARGLNNDSSLQGI